MGTTADFIKVRSSGTPKVGVWNSNYSKALALAKKEGKFIVTCWSNGDKCGYCVTAEKCMMQSAFTEFMKSSDAYFVFQYSGDKDQGKTLHDWIFTKGGVKQYPGFRVTLYDTKGNIVFDKAVPGNTLRSSKTGATGAKQMVAALKKMFDHKKVEPAPAPVPTPPAPYVVRLNEKLTTAQINKVLDALEKNSGYCPCQPKGSGTKCHCQDFVNNKKNGEPCICKIFVKQAPLVARRVGKPKPSDTILKVTDISVIDSTVGMTFMFSPHGPVVAKTPEEIDDFMGATRGTTREFMRKTGLKSVTAVKSKGKKS